MHTRYSHKRPPVLFVHVPKTAGTSVSSLLSSMSEAKWSIPPWRKLYLKKNALQKHACALDYRKRLGSSFNNTYKFTLVRNSWDWLWSFYRFIKFPRSDSETGKSNRHNLYSFVKDMDFDDFIEFVTVDNGLERLPAARRMKKLGYPEFNQYNFGHNLRGDLIVDRILQFENMEIQLRDMMLELGFDAAPLPKINISRNTGERYQDMYSPRTLQLVANKFRRDIQAFGFEY